ncbi:MAG: hypothetical protein ACRDF5_03960 [bacterium]
MRKFRSLVMLSALLLTLFLLPLNSVPLPAAQVASGVTLGEAVFRLATPGDSSAAAPQLSPQEVEALQERIWQLRERIAASSGSAPAGPAGVPPTGPELQLGNLAAQVHGVESAFVFGRSFENVIADNAGNSALAEPAGAGNARDVFMAGNFAHAERSINGGLTWTSIVLPAGPSDAPILCCDHDVMKDDARRLWIHSYLYINSTASNGVVRLDIRRNFSAVPACSYFLDPAGTANNILPDYPHIGLTDKNLWIATNEIVGGTTQRARMYRVDLGEIFDCVPTPTQTFFQWPFTTEGQKVWVPAEGANIRTYMVWSHGVSSTVDRWFLWTDTAAAPVNSTLSVPASTYATTSANADCRGGTNNADFWGFLNSSIHGFQRRNVIADNKVGTYYGVDPDAAHTQGHIHGYLRRVLASIGTGAPTLSTLIASTALANSTACVGFPHVTANKKGHLGFAVAFGGRAGGGGSAVTPAAGIADDFTSLTNPLVVFFYPGIASTHNPTRYGDYFNIHPDEPCEKWFESTGFGFEGGTTVTNLDSRWVEWGRNRYQRCWADFRTLRPLSE